MTDLPDGAAPQEEELNITGSQHQPRHVDAESTNKIEPHVANLQIGKPGASPQEFIDELLRIPEEQLIPWEECHLPSRGLYYGWQDDTVLVRAMGQTAEKVLATQRLAQSGQSIDYLFRTCCRFPNDFDPADLLLGDRVFLLYFLRGITYGNIYEFAVTCPNTACEAVNTHKYDLNELASTIIWADQSLGLEPFRVDLPYLSKATNREVWVGVRFLRAADANDMIAKRKLRKKMFAKPGGARSRMTPRQNSQQQQQIDETISENMEKIIVSVMGVSDPFTIRSFISRMHSQDTTAVREWLREHTPGIDNTIQVECPDCGGEFTTELPITESFFRPAKSG